MKFTQCFAHFATTVSIVAVAASVHAESSTITNGIYAVESQMVLPHLDEMRRVSDHQSPCIVNSDATLFFPVFHQPAMTGCALHPEEIGTETIAYKLICASANGATGTAKLSIRDGHVKGELKAKMGGKNMTFSQYIDATRTGECPPT
jgi:hypothetical protein